VKITFIMVPIKILAYLGRFCSTATTKNIPMANDTYSNILKDSNILIFIKFKTKQ